MHSTEKALIDAICTVFVDLGMDPSEAQIGQAVAFVLAEADPAFGVMFALFHDTAFPVVCSEFHGIRVLIRVGAPMPGLVTVLADVGRIETFCLEFDVGWGRAGLLIDETEKARMLRSVLFYIAEHHLPHHARLELISEIVETDGLKPLESVWSLFHGFDALSLIETACLRVQGATPSATI